jgi:hypothetical protein
MKSEMNGDILECGNGMDGIGEHEGKGRRRQV